MALQQDYDSEITFIIADVRTDEGVDLARKFGVRSIPYHILINRNGETFYAAAGKKSENFLRDKIKEIKEKR